MSRKKMLVAMTAVALGIAGAISMAQAGNDRDDEIVADLKSVRLDKGSMASRRKDFLRLLLSGTFVCSAAGTTGTTEGRRRD